MKIDLERIELMNIKSGDSIVITLESGITKESFDYIKYTLNRLYPNCKVLIMVGVKEIRVVRGLAEIVDNEYELERSRREVDYWKKKAKK